MSESVTSVGGGVISSTQHKEVVVCTYSGRVLGLSREPQSQQSLSQEASLLFHLYSTVYTCIVSQLHPHSVLSFACSSAVLCVSAGPGEAGWPEEGGTAARVTGSHGEG